MAADNLETEYHLTKTGWVVGNTRFFGKIQGKEIPRPDNTVETWINKIYQRSEWSKEERSWRLDWYDKKINENERNIFRNKIPKPSKDFPKGGHEE